MTFLMVLFVILLSLLMILFCTLNVIRHLICCNNLNWLLNLNLVYKTLWTGARSGLSISMLKNSTSFCLTGLLTLVLLIWKWIGSWLSLLSWIEALTLSLLLKLPPGKLEPWLVLWSCFFLRLLCISINLPYGHARNTVVMDGLVLLVATWNWWRSYNNGKIDTKDCWSFTYCLSWTLGSLSKCSWLKYFL